MKTNKGFASLILVSIVGFLVLAILALTIYSKTWRSYTYDKNNLGYTLKYPMSWDVEETDNATEFRTKDKTISFSITPETNTTFKTMDSKIIEYGNIYDMKLHGSQALVDNKAGFEIEFNDRPRWDLFFSGDNNKVPASIFTVSLYYQNNNKDQALNMLREILATMHITNSSGNAVANTMGEFYETLNFVYRSSSKYASMQNDVEYFQRTYKLPNNAYLDVIAYKLNNNSKNIITILNQTRDLDKEVQTFNKLRDGLQVATTYGDLFQPNTEGSKERIGAHKYLIYDVYNKDTKVWSKSYVTHDEYKNQLVKISLSFIVDDPATMNASYEKTKGYYYYFEYPEVIKEYIKALNATLSTL